MIETDLRWLEKNSNPVSYYWSLNPITPSIPSSFPSKYISLNYYLSAHVYIKSWSSISYTPAKYNGYLTRYTYKFLPLGYDIVYLFYSLFYSASSWLFISS